MGYEIRAIEPDEIPAFLDAMGLGFGWDRVPDHDPHFAAVTECERTRCVFDGGELVGTSGAFSLDLTVPGASLPTGGTTYVTVRGTHRRRGLLTEMMRAHLDDVRERGEPLAALWASESAIYERFGYGCASLQASMELERAHTAFARPLALRGALRMIAPREAAALLPPVYEAFRRERPGAFARSAAWWEHRRLYDPVWGRRGASKFRYAVYEADGVARGFAQYRIGHGPGAGGLSGDWVELLELQALDPEATAALWRHLGDIDLVRSIRAEHRPVDDALPWLLADPRRLRTSVWDALWLRPMDVPRALEGRRYASEGRLDFALEDGFLPDNSGTYRLEVGADGAHCTRAAVEPELKLSAADLGAIYLGGHRPSALARGGHIRGGRDALRRADALFAWDCAPWCPEVF